jgi:hypothetical protein
MSFDLKQEATRLNESGLNVLPATKTLKRPVGSWREYRENRRAIDEAFDHCDALAIVCGAVSGNVEIIDFDAQAVDFDDWCQRVAELDADAAQALFSCVLETTQSGGKHLAYRCETAVDGNLKLTTRNVDGAAKTTIETRGEGGIVIVAPTAGYTVVRGDWASLPVVSAATRQTFLDAARSLSDVPKEPPKTPNAAPRAIADNVDSIADWMMSQGVTQRLLTANGWRYVETRGSNEHWRRPGKDDGVSGTLKLENGVFYVFSSNAAPLEPNRAYSALQLAAAFDFGGDERAAARHYGDERAAASAPILPDIIVEPTKKKGVAPSPLGPPVFPPELMEVGGLLGEIMAYTETQEYKPQPTLRFAGALALMSFLTARKLSIYGSTRSNLYIVGLAESGGGKDAARAANARILTACDAPAFPERFKSASAFWETIQLHGAVFSQIDEFGLFLKAVNADSSHLNALAGAMLRAFTLSSYDKVSVDAGVTNIRKPTEPLVFPSFTFYGTSTYTDFVESMTEKQLQNGFSARCTFFAGDKNAVRNYRDYYGYVTPSVPESLIKRCREWLAYRSTFAVEVPTAFDVPRTPSANEILRANEERAEAAQKDKSDAIRTFYARIAEKMKKYALVFAASKFGPKDEKLIVDDDVASQAVALSNYETSFFEYLLENEIATSESEANVNAAKKWMKTLENGRFTKSEFTRRFQRLGKPKRDELMETIVDLGVVEKVVVKENRANKFVYIVKL